jgi:hypothetical protein
MTTDVIVDGFRATDSGSNIYSFDLMPTGKGGWGFTLQPTPWEPADPAQRWRIPLHPWIGGLNEDRLHSGAKTYAKANADATYPNILLPPPKVNSLTMANGSTPIMEVNFDSMTFQIGGRYAYYFNTALNTVVEDKDFGADKSAVFAVVFNNQLIVAMGASEKIWTRSIGVNTSGTADAAVTTTDTTLTDTRLALTVNAYIGATVTSNGKTMVVTSNTATTFTGASWSGGSNPGNGFAWSVAGTWTQASDNVFALAFAVSGAPGQGNYVLWRGHDTNQVSSTTTAPRTLANYTPADPNEYLVGDTSYAIYDMADYGGVVWVRKGDGLYAPDAQGRFKNQAPQLSKTPSTDSNHRMFIAQGALWVPAIDGLYRIRPGKSHKMGPELTFRPNYRFRVRNGVEYGDFLYLICTDSGTNEATFICKMNADVHNETIGHEYIYQEWARLDGTSVGYAIAVNTAGTNPKIVATYAATGVRYITLGRGGGRDADDSSYAYGTSLIVETGVMAPAADLSMLSTLVGIDVLCDYSRTNESLSLAYRWDSKTGAESYTDLLNTSEGGGTAAITTTGWDKVSRYAASNNQGRFLEAKITGTIPDGTVSTTRPVIREAWAHGYSHPTHTDVISLAILLYDAPTTGGKPGAIETERLFRDWQNEGMEIIGELHGYERSRNTRFLIRKVERVNVDVTAGTHPRTATTLDQLKVQLVRVDRASAYAD